jgi:hypothetical protein
MLRRVSAPGIEKHSGELQMHVQSAIRAISAGLCVAVLAGCLGIIGFGLVFIF